jgi:hypothetical protein
VSEAADIESEEYPWPRKGDDPFAFRTSDPNLIACLNFTFDEPWGGYAEGFKRLADLGVSHCEQTGRDQDFLIYPILFGYRHYVELSLKEIIRAARRLLDEIGGVPENHNLTDLWNTAEPLLKRIEPKGHATLRHVRECIARFTELDPTSEAGRYPVRRGGELSLPEDLRQLDLGQLRDVVERLSGFLEAAAEQTIVYLDYKAEMAREYSPDPRDFEPDW